MECPGEDLNLHGVLTPLGPQPSRYPQYWIFRAVIKGRVVRNRQILQYFGVKVRQQYALGGNRGNAVFRHDSE